MDIDSIRNIGEKRKGRLEEEGYLNIEDIAFADPRDIQRVLGISKEQAETIVDDAYRLYSEYNFWQQELEKIAECGDVVICEEDEGAEQELFLNEFQKRQYTEAFQFVNKTLLSVEYDFIMER